MTALTDWRRQQIAATARSIKRERRWRKIRAIAETQLVNVLLITGVLWWGCTIGAAGVWLVEKVITP